MTMGSPGLRRPVLGVPAADPVRCFALSLYGPHAVGTDLNADERAMLSRLARFAAAMYAELEAVELRHRIAMLERKFKARVITGISIARRECPLWVNS